MVHINVVLTVRNEADISTVRELMLEQGRLSLQEPGCIRFEVFHSQSDRRSFLLVEQWESQAALDTHRGAWACENIYKPRVLPLVDRVPHPSDKIV